jgi:hypothetical protein
MYKYKNTQHLQTCEYICFFFNTLSKNIHYEVRMSVIQHDNV